MDPNVTTAAILVICLILVISIYFLGYSTGRTLCAYVNDKGSFLPQRHPCGIAR